MKRQGAPQTQRKKRAKKNQEEVPAIPDDRLRELAKVLIIRHEQVKWYNLRKKQHGKDLSKLKAMFAKKMAEANVTTFNAPQVQEILQDPPGCVVDANCAIDLKHKESKFTWEREKLLPDWVQHCGITPEQADLCYQYEHETFKSTKTTVEITDSPRVVVNIP